MKKVCCRCGSRKVYRDGTCAYCSGAWPRKVFVFLFVLVLVPFAHAVVPCPGGRGAFKLDYFVGESMVPEIYPGDDVYIRLGSSRKVVAGDVVAVRYEGTGFDIGLRYRGERPRWLVHRLMGFGKHGSFVLKGDNNAFRDPVLFPKSSLAGVVCFVRHR